MLYILHRNVETEKKKKEVSIQSTPSWHHCLHPFSLRLQSNNSHNSVKCVFEVDFAALDFSSSSRVGETRMCVEEWFKEQRSLFAAEPEGWMKKGFWTLLALINGDNRQGGIWGDRSHNTLYKISTSWNNPKPKQTPRIHEQELLKLKGRTVSEDFSQGYSSVTSRHFLQRSGRMWTPAGVCMCSSYCVFWCLLWGNWRCRWNAAEISSGVAQRSLSNTHTHARHSTSTPSSYNSYGLHLSLEVFYFLAWKQRRHSCNVADTSV